MKGHLRHLAMTGLAAGILSISPAQADAPSWFGHPADGTWYLGGKLSTIQNGYSPDPFQPAFFSDTQAGHIVGGYEFARAVTPHGTAAIEIELYKSFDEGNGRDFADRDISWKANGVAAYAVWRSAGDIYLKAKLGVHNSRVNVYEFGRKVTTHKDTNLGYGVGLGLRLKNNTNIEIEVTGDNGREWNNFQSITLGGHVNF